MTNTTIYPATSPMIAPPMIMPRILSNELSEEAGATGDMEISGAEEAEAFGVTVKELLGPGIEVAFAPMDAVPVELDVFDTPDTGLDIGGVVGLGWAGAETPR